MSFIRRSGLMLAVLLLAFMFVVPWAKIVPWRDGPGDVDQPLVIDGSLSAERNRTVDIDDVDAALIAREPPAPPMARRAR